MVVCNYTLAKGLTNGVDLGNMTTATYSDSDIEVLEALKSEEKNGFVHLNPKRLGFKKIDWGSVDAQDALAFFNFCVGN